MKLKKIVAKTGAVFSEIDKAQVIVQKAGTYKQVPIAVREGLLYAKVGGGYVRLKDKFETSAPGVRWHEIVSTTNEEFVCVIGKIGWLEALPCN